MLIYCGENYNKIPVEINDKPKDDIWKFKKKSYKEKKWKSVFKKGLRQPYEYYTQNLNCEVYKPHQVWYMDYKEV